ncbi:MAG TPA: family 43 glycosylhydrolase, partial [Polyangiaceae bacterium]|nr:family 43 glycosylhydrolase [Polyangiaceae bacterium]
MKRRYTPLFTTLLLLPFPLGCGGELEEEAVEVMEAACQKSARHVWPTTPAVTYDNPVLPGDHADLNVYREGNDFYIVGSNFAMFPALEILHSTDLLHWERVSRVVNADAAALDGQTGPGQGTWGAFIVKAEGEYRIYYAINATQYFSSAPSLRGPWSEPTRVNTWAYVPPGSTVGFERGSGSDNSVFTDPDSSKTYMLIKNGACQWNGDTVNPNTFGINLVTEINPADGMLVPETSIDLSFVNWDTATGGCGPADNPDYSKWAEGPTMMKRNGWYYYFVSTHTACGGQLGAWASKKLVGSTQADWTWLGYVLTGEAPYAGLQHASAPMELADGTWWAFAHSYDCTNNDGTVEHHGEWVGLAREGLLTQVTWVDTDVNGTAIPVPHFTTAARNLPAPQLPPSGIPFLLPTNDNFAARTLGPTWTTYDRMGSNYSVTKRPGWLSIVPEAGSSAWVVQKEALRSTATVVRMDFRPHADGDTAGVRVGNGFWQDEQVLSGPTWIEGQGFLVGIFDVSVARVMENGADNIRFAFRSRTPVPTGGSGSYTELADPVVVSYSVPAPARSTVWLKLARSNHQATGWYSTDRIVWKQVGEAIDITALDDNYGMSNAWVGNQAGMFAVNRRADFDLFTYRDGFTTIPAAETNQQFGTDVTTSTTAGAVLGNLSDGDWAMYGSVDLGSGGVATRGVEFNAASLGGADVEVWLDPLAGGTRAAVCKIPDTGDWEAFGNVRCNLAASGTHEVYLRFRGPAEK